MREGKGFGSITPKVSTYLRKKTYHKYFGSSSKYFEFYI